MINPPEYKIQNRLQVLEKYSREGNFFLLAKWNSGKLQTYKPRMGAALKALMMLLTEDKIQISKMIKEIKKTMCLI